MFDEPAVGFDRRARRRTGHARNRPARSGADRRRHRRHRARPAARPSASMRPPACRRWLQGAGRGFAVRTRAGADRAGGDPVRSARAAATRIGAAYPPYRELGYAAAAAAGLDFALGSVGAGHRRHHRQSARAASARPRRMSADGHTVGALAVVNAVGSVTDRRRTVVLGGAVRARRRIRRRWAAAELFRRGARARTPRAARRESTTLVVVATDAMLNKAQAKRLAVMAQTGSRARHLSGAHAARRRRGVCGLDRPQAARRSARRTDELGALAANVVARAIARGVFEATALPFPGAVAELGRPVRRLKNGKLRQRRVAFSAGETTIVHLSREHPSRPLTSVADCASESAAWGCF